MFRDLIRRAFNLKLNCAQLGALVKEFSPECDGLSIPCGDFLKYFLRLGVDMRDRERADQRRRQQFLDLQAQQAEKKRLEDEALKYSKKVDAKFSEADGTFNPN